MLRPALRNLLARKLRLLLSTFAIVIGVAFVAGSFVFTDTLDEAFDSIVDSSVGDVIVRPEIAGSGDATFQGLDQRTLPADLVDTLAAVPGAERADGNVTVTGVFVLDENGDLIGGQGPPGLAVNYSDAPNAAGAQVAQLAEGEWPDGAGEVTVDAGTAETSGYEIGDTVPLVSVGDTPELEAELVGTFEFGTALIGASVVVLDTDDMRGIFFDGDDVFTDIWVTSDESTSQAELASAVEAELPAGVEAITGDSAAQEQKDTIGEALAFINIFLLVFAVVSVVVGTFIIVNTFSILVAQRSRELALLRALGASRPQITRLVLLEALAVGFIGSTIGIGLGFLLALGLRALFATFGLDLSGTDLVFRPRTLLLSYVVGILVTLVAAYFPARRAGRIAPVEALRDGVALPETTVRRRLVVGAVLSALGAGLVTAGLLGTGGQGALLVGGGILAVLLGVALATPILGRPVLVGLRAAYRRAYGAVGNLSGENALRNPRRTGATASALMIGVALVATVAVLGQTAKASTDEILNEQLAADIVVSNSIGQPFSPGVAERAAETDGVDTAVPLRSAPATVEGRDEFYVAATEPEPFAEMVTLDAVAGAVADFTDGTVLVEEGRAEDEGLAPGDTITLTLPGGDQELEVAAVYEQEPIVGSPYLFTLSAFTAGGLRPQDTYVYITLAEGTDANEVQAALEAQVTDLPLVSVKDQTEFADEIRGQIDQFLRLIYALLGLAIVIAVLGIVNTLALSVIERTREVGLLRAIGMQRHQLRRMVRLESVAIAVLGAVLGVVMGVVFGVVLQRAIADQGLQVLSIPVVQLVVFVVLAALLGVLAAVLPARRASRLDVLRAIGTE